MERNEHFTKKELEKTEAELTRCEDTLDAEGSIIDTFEGDYVHVRVTQEQSDHINEIQNNSDDDFTWPNNIGIASSQNSETESDRESDTKSDKDGDKENNKENNKEYDKESDIKSDNETKNYKDASDYRPVSSGVTATEDSSNPLPSDVQTTIFESMPKTVREWFDTVMNGTGSSSKNPSENPSNNPSNNPSENSSSANLSTINGPSTDPSQKIEEKAVSSVDPSQKTEEKSGSSVSTDSKNTGDKKLTPGDYVDGLPQDMPS